MEHHVCSHCKSSVEVPESWQLSNFKCSVCNKLFHIKGRTLNDSESFLASRSLNYGPSFTHKLSQTFPILKPALVLTMVFGAVIVFCILISDPPDDIRKHQNLIINQPTEAQRLTANSDGYDWNNASYELKMSLCEDIARRAGEGKRDASWYFSCINGFYNSNPQPEILREQIRFPAAAGGTIDDGQ